MSPRAKVRKKTTVRKTRPALPRTEPIRSWSTLFGAAAPGGAAGAPGFPSAVESVNRGVELGYRVIDEYVKQGAALAGNLSSASTGTPSGVPDLAQMTERMLKSASDFASLWFDAMGVMISSRNGAGTPDASGMPRTAAPQSSGTPGITLQLRAAQPVEVLITIDSTLTPGAPLVVESLRARSASASLEDVSVDVPAEPAGPLKIRITIPKGMPADRYTGAIIDAGTRNPRGRLTVTVPT